MSNPYKDFDEYGLRHMPEHLIDLEQWDTLEAFLSDLYFIEAKYAAGMTYDLIADYAATLDALPDAQEDNRIAREREARVQKYIQDLIAYSKGDIQTLDIIPSVEPWSEERIKADIERIKTNPTRLDRIRAFAQFVNAESHILIKFADHPGFVIQQAYNFANSGPVANAAETLIRETKDILLLQVSSTRPEYNPHPALIRRIDTKARDYCVTPDGKQAVMFSGVKLWVWDLESGICLHTLEGHTDSINCVHITPDGRLAVSGSVDTTVCVWDMVNGICLHKLEGHTKAVMSINIRPDGKYAVSGSCDKTARIWDTEHGICLDTLEGHTNLVEHVMIMPDGKRIVSFGGESYYKGFSCDYSLRVWDVERGECLHIMQSALKNQHESEFKKTEGEPYSWSFEEQVTKVSGSWIGITLGLNGKLAGFSNNWDQVIEIWDLEHGTCLHTFTGDLIQITADGQRAVVVNNGKQIQVKESNSTIFTNAILQVKDLKGDISLSIEGQTYKIHGLHITPDGKFAVSGSQDQSIRIWDLEHGACLKTLTGHSMGTIWHHTDWVNISVDGRRALSLGEDHTLLVWELERSFCMPSYKRSPDTIVPHEAFPQTAPWVENVNKKIWPNLMKKYYGQSYTIFPMDTPDGRYIVSRTGDHHTLQLWDGEEEKLLGVIVSYIESLSDKVEEVKVNHSINDVKVIPDGTHVLVISENLKYDKKLRLWNIRNSGCRLTLEEITTGSLTPDGRRFVSQGTRDKSMQVWDLKRGICLHTLTGHTDAVNSFTITPDGRWAVSGSEDKTVRLWDLASGTCFGIYHAGDEVKRIPIIRPGKHLIYEIPRKINRFLSLYNVPMGPPIVTSRRLWLYGEYQKIKTDPEIKTDSAVRHGVWETLRKMLKKDQSEEISESDNRIEKIVQNPGCWDENITTVCQWCGESFPISASILDVINGITRAANLTPDQSPCLELPDEAWDEPKLLSECPLCHQLLKFNPFVVDNRGK